MGLQVGLGDVHLLEVHCEPQRAFPNLNQTARFADAMNRYDVRHGKPWLGTGAGSRGMQAMVASRQYLHRADLLGPSCGSSSAHLQS